MIKCYVYLNSTLILERITINTNKVLLFYVQPHCNKIDKDQKEKDEDEEVMFCSTVEQSRAVWAGAGTSAIVLCANMLCKIYGQLKTVRYQRAMYKYV